MSDEKPCSVPDCPAYAVGRLTTCELHKKAALAKSVGCADRPCVSCGRKIKKEDYVWKAMRPIEHKKRSGETHGWCHVACEPPTARLTPKKIKESVKPLLAEL